MTINIESREVEDAIDRLRMMTGKDTVALIAELVAAEIAKQEKLRDIEGRKRRIDELSAAYRARVNGPLRPIEELLEYDENGLPR